MCMHFATSVASPQNEAVVNGTIGATLGRSSGFEGMAI